MEHYLKLLNLLMLMLVMCCSMSLTTACSSRDIPKSRPMVSPSSSTTIESTPRPNITFPIFACPPTYAAWYCLNDATCFTVEIHNEILYNCECASGFMGPRCEYKEIDGSYLPTRRRAMLETASIASGATLALLFMLILCLSLYIHHEKKRKMKINISSNMSHNNLGMDEIDGITKVASLRPFGPHHYEVLPLAFTFKRS